MIPRIREMPRGLFWLLRGLSWLLGGAARLLGTVAGRFVRPAWRDLAEESWDWIQENARFYAVSTAVHTFVFGLTMLVLSRISLPEYMSSPVFVPVTDDLEYAQPLTRFDMSRMPLEPSELNSESLTVPQLRSVKAQFNDNSPIFKEAGGGRKSVKKGPDLGGAGGFKVVAATPGPLVDGAGGIGPGAGDGKHAGRGGAGEGFGARGSGHRDAIVGAFGGTKDTERSVAASLGWFFRHRNGNGSWSLGRFNTHCVGNQCTGTGTADSDVAGTSLALLSFLGAGETHKGKGPYRETVNQALYWLMKQQQTATGDSSGGSSHKMYCHALAAIALCEAYGMTKDPKVGDAAQRAINFIVAAQNQRTGGWRYLPGEEGDTSVLGWQIMALRSAQLAGLSVSTMTMENAKKWLASVAKGSQHGLYAYQPYREATPTITAIGMLSYQYIGMRADDPAMIDGKQYLMENLPDNGLRNTYYWYYATQVMHNLLGPDWDAWNRRMRRILIESQIREGCASGSWDPESPTLDAWSQQGGRIVTTAFSTLTLEVYYRYLPLYNLDPATDPARPLPPSASALDGAQAGNNRAPF